jgi:hypothetical protein
MTQFTAANYLSNAGRTEAELKVAFEDNLAATKQLLGGAAQSTLTLVSDQITPTGAFHLVDTQAAAATDNLAQILQTNLPDGSWLILGIVSASRTVVFKHAAGGTGQLTMLGGVDVTVDNVTTFLSFQRRGTLWEERQRFYGNAVTAFKNFYQVAGLGQNTFTGRQEWHRGADLTAAGTLVLGTDGNYFHVLGAAAAITGISSAPAGTPIMLVFEDFATLTHNATNLVLTPAVSRVMVPGEPVIVVSDASGNWREISGVGGGVRVLYHGPGGTHNASQGETSIASYTIPAKTLGLIRRLRWTAHCSLAWRNNGADTLTLRLKYGGTLCSEVLVNDPTGTGSGVLRVEAWISEASATNAQFCVMTLDGQTSPLIQSSHSSQAVDAAVAQTFEVTAQFGALGSPAGVAMAVNHCILELV